MKSEAAYMVFTLVVFLFFGPSHESKVIDNGVRHRSSSLTSGQLASAHDVAVWPLKPTSRLLAQHNPRVTMTCDSFPRICRAKGSPGPDCCKKQCVNVMADGLNCGNKCKYGEACCRGNCVNVMYDRHNCGGCNRRCNKGSYCRYGMCSYA